MTDVIVIENHAFPAWPKSSDSDPQDRYEENIWAAMHTLEDIRQSRIPAHFVDKYAITSMQAWLMFLNLPVARHYEVKKDDVWQAYSKHFGPGLAAEIMGIPPEVAALGILSRLKAKGDTDP